MQHLYTGKQNEIPRIGTFTYGGKYEYAYNVSGDLDSVPGYDPVNTKETEMDYIY